MNKETTAVIKKDSSPVLVPNKTAIYRADGIRYVYRGGDVWESESDAEFMIRFKKGECEISDLDRVCNLHPLLLEYAKDGKNYKNVIEGIAYGKPMRPLFKDNGFISWAVFRSMTEYLCPGLKRLLALATEHREEARLQRAEAEMERRGIEGYEEEVYTPSGKFAGYRKRYSDKMLEMNLKALAPEKYSEKHQHEVKGMVVSVNMDLGLPPSEEENKPIIESTDE